MAQIDPGAYVTELGPTQLRFQVRRIVFACRLAGFAVPVRTKSLERRFGQGGLMIKTVRVFEKRKEWRYHRLAFSYQGIQAS